MKQARTQGWVTTFFKVPFLSASPEKIAKHQPNGPKDALSDRIAEKSGI